MMLIHTIIDLERYPIDDLDKPGAHALIAYCHQQLARDGLCLLPDFVRPPALQTMLDEARSLAPGAYRTEHWRASANGATADDPGTLARATRASIGAVACDHIKSDSSLRVLYRWDGLTAFINAVLYPDGPALYRTDDPLVDCMLTVMLENDELGWHYDPNDGVVSLLLQAPERGGEFQFAPAVRAPAAHAAADEQALLDGCYEGLISHRLRAGTLSLFNGHRALHRVAPVGGARARIIALFNYADRLNYRFSDDIHKRFFGRTAETRSH